MNAILVGLERARLVERAPHADHGLSSVVGNPFQRLAGRVHSMVVFNLTRFARDKYDHFALRSLQRLGISLRSDTEPIDDTSSGNIMEGLLAAFAQRDNDCRSDRTRAGMTAACRSRP